MKLNNSLKRTGWGQYFLLGFALFIFGVGVPKYSDLSFVAFSVFFIRYRDVLDWRSLFLFLFCVSYAFIDVGELSHLVLSGKFAFVVVSIASYLIGKRIFVISIGKQGRAIALFFIIQIAWMLFSVLAIYATVVNEPTLLLGRHFISFFFDDIEMHALYMTASFVIVIASTPFLLYWLVKNAFGIEWHQKLVFMMVLIAGLIGLLINNVLQNRSPFAVLLVTALLPILFLPRNDQKISKVGYILLLTIALVIGVGTLLYFGFSTDDFLSNGKTSRLDTEELSTNGRADVWLLGLEMIPQYPLGGIIMPPGYESTEGYFHNFWLDVAKVSGYVPLLLILVFQLAHVRGILIVLFSRFTFEHGVISIFLVCIAFMYLTEPIHQLMPQFHYFTLMLFGYLSMLQKQTKLIRRIRS